VGSAQWAARISQTADSRHPAVLTAHCSSLTAHLLGEADDPRNRLPHLNLSLLSEKGGASEAREYIRPFPDSQELLAISIGRFAGSDASAPVRGFALPVVSLKSLRHLSFSATARCTCLSTAKTMRSRIRHCPLLGGLRDLTTKPYNRHHNNGVSNAKN
jgi:hypothetical protein